MHADISRDSFQPERHYSSVVWQQGRVQLDSEINENTAILLHQLRTFIVDVIGRTAAPAVKDATGKLVAGFGVTFTNDQGRRSCTISSGRYYVDGIACENPVQDLDYHHQPYAYLSSTEPFLRDPPVLVCLRVWERLVTAVADPSIREVALGAHTPDTAGRKQVAWQLAAFAGHMPGSRNQLSPDNVASEFATWWQREEMRKRLLRVRCRPAELGADPCRIPPEALFRGAENQFYRVEIHSGGVGVATFKWSRDNGSVMSSIMSVQGDVVQLESLGRDGRLAFEVGQYVEILDDTMVNRIDHLVRPLRQVIAVDIANRAVTLAPVTASPGAPPQDTIGTVPARHPILRRWDHVFGQDPPPLAALPIKQSDGDGDGAWQDLEDGIQVQFPSGCEYRPGDYWQFEARTLIGDVIWPVQNGAPQAMSAKGDINHWAPLALEHSGGVLDLRCMFLPTCEQPQSSHGAKGTLPKPQDQDQQSTPEAVRSTFPHVDVQGAEEVSQQRPGPPVPPVIKDAGSQISNP